MKTFLKRFIFLAFVVVVLFGCSNNSNANVGKNEDRDTNVEGKKEPTSLFSYPLTGKVSSEKPDHRAIAVMINNAPQARPQSGLHKADLVYEILAEGGITRYLAVFHSEMPEVVGPVRSARDYYIELAKGLDALFVFHGWSPEAKKMIQSGYIDNLNGLFYDGTLFKRASFRVAPHNSYITYENILKGAEKNEYSMRGAPVAYKFLKEDEEIVGESHQVIEIDYSSDSFEVQYKYDEKEGRYSRYLAGELAVDLETEEPIKVDNILIVQMDHKIIDKKGRREIDLNSGGSGYLIQKGKVQEIEWQNVNGRVVPFKNGKELSLVPGKTWINIVPNLNTVTLK